MEYLSPVAAAELTTADTSATDSCRPSFGEHRQVTLVLSFLVVIMVVVNGIAGRGGPGVGTLPELPSGVHTKRKNPVRIFS